MPKTIEMIVSLKVPDNTALTALQTLRRLGFSKIRDLKRADFYRFSIDGDPEKFKSSISKVDVIVNANKHAFSFEIPQDGAQRILVKNIDEDGKSLAALLSNLGVRNLRKVSKYTMWTIFIEEKDSSKTAEKAAKELLVNENYQEFIVL